MLSQQEACVFEGGGKKVGKKKRRKEGDSEKKVELFK
jgi:hypothetical protein